MKTYSQFRNHSLAAKLFFLVELSIKELVFSHCFQQCKLMVVRPWSEMEFKNIAEVGCYTVCISDLAIIMQQCHSVIPKLIVTLQKSYYTRHWATHVFVPFSPRIFFIHRIKKDYRLRNNKYFPLIPELTVADSK